jgi:hypothetical protein
MPSNENISFQSNLSRGPGVVHSILTVTRSIALLLVGLYAGGLLFVVLAPSVGRLPGPAYVRHWQALNNDYGSVMPPLLLTSALMMTITAALSWHRGRAVFVLSVVALVLVVLTIVLTVTAMEPLNRLADSWDPDGLPQTWPEIRERWAALHLGRTFLAVVAFACITLTQAIDR